jgi:hypothetical protein
MITEWGYRAAAMPPVTGNQSTFGDLLKAYIEAQRLGWTAWCADTIWESAMFDADWSLRVGPDEMGGFTKDWLAEKKDTDRPGNGSRDGSTSGSGGAGTAGSGGSGGSGAGGAGEAGGAGGDPGTDGGFIDCDVHIDEQSCAAAIGCYWRGPDCNHATAGCDLEGGLPRRCP